jgi:hypothetical protein
MDGILSRGPGLVLAAALAVVGLATVASVPSADAQLRGVPEDPRSYERTHEETAYGFQVTKSGGYLVGPGGEQAALTVGIDATGDADCRVTTRET